MSFVYRLIVLSKLNNLVKEWISELGESKVRIFFVCSYQNSWSLFSPFSGRTTRIYAEVQLLTLLRYQVEL